MRRAYLSFLMVVAVLFSSVVLVSGGPASSPSGADAPQVVVIDQSGYPAHPVIVVVGGTAYGVRTQLVAPGPAPVPNPTPNPIPNPSPDPIPNPQPDPVPNPSPTPTPISDKLFVTVIYDLNTVTPASSAVYRSSTLAPALRALNCEYRNLDATDPDVSRLKLSDWIASARVPYPALIIQRQGVGKPFYIGPMPATEAAFVALINGIRKGDVSSNVAP